VRAGLITREEGFELAREHDAKRPDKALDYYLEITGLTEREFFQAMAVQRDPRLPELEIPAEPETPGFQLTGSRA